MPSIFSPLPSDIQQVPPSSQTRPELREHGSPYDAVYGISPLEGTARQRRSPRKQREHSQHRQPGHFGHNSIKHKQTGLR